MSKHWKDVVKNAGNYLAIGQREVWLSEYDGYHEFPWHLVTKLEPGCTRRIDIATSITFYAELPAGIALRWSFDTEKRSADGRGYYEIDVEAVQSALDRIPTRVRPALHQYLKDCAVAIRKNADQYNEIATREYHMARELERASQ